MTPSLPELEQRMQPGAWDTHGFMLHGASLADVVASDAAKLASLGVTAAQVGQDLALVLESGAASDWLRPFKAGPYSVEILRRRGFITCPWATEEFQACAAGHPFAATANQFRIVRRLSRQSLEGFVLSSHLIQLHGFFGGPGSRFRIEPEQAVAVLGLHR
jgi:hypothetical protein